MKCMAEMYIEFTAQEVNDGGTELMALKFERHIDEFLELLREKVTLDGTDIIRVHVRNMTLDAEMFADVIKKHDEELL